MDYRANGKKIQRSFAVEDFTIDLPNSDTSETIYGKLLIPETASPARPVPAIIFAHFYNGTYRDTYTWAAPFAQEGYLSVIFDFRGGGRSSQSSGTSTSMSVLTEKDDLLAVIDAVSKLDMVNSSMLFLCGESQGGLVAALTAAHIPEKIRGLMLLYPAFVIPDKTRARFKSPADFPEVDMRMGLEVGRKYYEDVWDMDAYTEAQSYPGPVTIYHGTGDTIVEIDSAQRAADSFPNAQFHAIKGAGHSFHGILHEQISGELIDFVAVACGEKTRAQRNQNKKTGKLWAGFGRGNLRKLWE